MRFVRAVLVAVVVLGLFAWGFAKLTSDDGPTGRPKLTQGLAGISISTTTKVRLSPDGAKLAVVEAGQVTIVGLDDAHVIARAGRNVVDATWMPDSDRVIVVEGPLPTGQIAAVDLKGAVAGIATLQPSIGFGDGLGLGIDARGTRAAVIAVTRDAVGGQAHADLAVVDFATGAVRLYPTPNRDEARPIFLDGDTIAVASQGPNTPARLDTVDVASGAVKAGRPIIDGPFVRTAAGDAVVARRAAQGAIRLLSVETETGQERDLHVTKPHRRVVAVDVQVTRAIVRVPDGHGGGTLAIDPFA